jgi:glycosyltransferase involved in cell wall biosynthesis
MSFLFLGDLPDPVHGMSNVNRAILDVFELKKHNPIVINTVPSAYARFYGTFLWSLLKVFHSVICLIRIIQCGISKDFNVVYRPINGGVGQVFDIFYFILVRLLFKEIIIHHHSFNYLNKYSFLFRLVLFVSGSEAKHVVLGLSMKNRLVSLYDIPEQKVIILSNSAFFRDDLNIDGIDSNPNQPLVIGHLGNLCVEKGLDVFIEVCRRLNSADIPFVAKIAGPFSDVNSMHITKQICEELENVIYLGPVYGHDKFDFFKSLDVFIFPSKYKNEAEPLVLYEGAQFGVLNLGTQVGCMEEVLKKLAGASFSTPEELIDDIVRVLIEDFGGLKTIRSTKLDRIKYYLNARDVALSSLNCLLQLIDNQNAKS